MDATKRERCAENGAHDRVNLFAGHGCRNQWVFDGLHDCPGKAVPCFMFHNTFGMDGIAPFDGLVA